MTRDLTLERHSSGRTLIGLLTTENGVPVRDQTIVSQHGEADSVLRKRWTLLASLMPDVSPVDLTGGPDTDRPWQPGKGF